MTDDLSLEALYEDAPCGYLSLDAGGVVTRVNRTLLRCLGLTSDAILGRPLLDLLTVGSRLYAQTHWWPRLELEGGLREMPVDLLRADGSRVCILLSATRVEGDAPAERGYRVVLFDATDRRRYEQQLIAARDEERAARERVERLQRMSNALAAAVGVERVAQAIADGVWEGLAPEACAVRLGGRVILDRRERFGSADTVTQELPLDAGGARIGLLTVDLAAGRTLCEAERSFLEAVAAQGATALRRAHLYAQTRHLAYHDPLTDLPNRRALTEHLDAQLARLREAGQPFCVAVVGLDDFKLLNDTHGHAVGDEVLRGVARRLKAALRDDDFVGRLSGDEFAVVWRGSGDHADSVAARLVDTLSVPLRVDRGEVFVRAAVGIAVPDEHHDAERVVADADVAMVAAKANGTGPLRFHAALREQARERVRVEAELREALRTGQLRVFYQPIVRADDGALAAVEALVRWEHPRRGLIAPDVFIPVAEATGLIVDLGRFVLREACAQLATWRSAGVVDEPVGVTVNVSARQLRDAGLVADVRAALADAGLARMPELLGLELTESMVMDADGDPEAELAALGDVGVRLLLDDFGTGASSLARLRRLPVDTLKIDRAFVSGLGQSGGEDDAIVAAIVALAGALELDVVAEGVETAEQADALLRLGVARLQGYRFGAPCPASALAVWGPVPPRDPTPLRISLR